jgi:8-oxo-dGTP pyrophosphatase MutT (NUDIX family)
VPVTPRDAATVILLRALPASPAAGASADASFEVFLLRRRKNASFMSGAFVFPGGAADDGEAEPRVTAARELFEEAGILLARPTSIGPMPMTAAELGALRERIHAGEPLVPALTAAGLEVDVDALHYFSHWITPSAEPRRFSARFYVAVIPAGQEPRFDERETVDQVWVTPRQALDRVGELSLPPPQVRTFVDLLAASTVDDVLAMTAARTASPHPVMPRLAPMATGFALLLPWDPEYLTAGTGDAEPMPTDHPLATGPTRFVMEDRAWKHVYAPPSIAADS